MREVFKHELAHQYVDEAMRIHDDPAHGAAFTEVCHARGIDGSAAGFQQPARTARPRRARRGSLAAS